MRGHSQVVGTLLVTLTGLTFLCSAARGADIETRDFAVLVGGKAAGEVHMTIHKQDGATTSFRCDTDIKVSAGLITYKYSFRGMEVWKDRRLIRLESTTDDNSKRFSVSAAATPTGLKVKANHVEKLIKGDAWSSSYWMLPDPKVRDGSLTILDADCGKELSGKLTYVGTEKHRVAGQEVTLNHYKLAGSVSQDLWYDGHDRLVRQEWSEQGYKAVMVLVRIRR